jgi:uncharacterized membrane protein
MSTPETSPPAAPVKEDTTIALLAYITPLLMGVGIVIAIVMHGNKKTALGAYHLRQSLGLLLSAVALGVPFMVPVLNILWAMLSPLLGLVSLGFFILWIIGIINALNGQQKPLPLVGQYYQKWFATAFN